MQNHHKPKQTHFSYYLRWGSAAMRTDFILPQIVLWGDELYFILTQIVLWGDITRKRIKWNMKKLLKTIGRISKTMSINLHQFWIFKTMQQLWSHPQGEYEDWNLKEVMKYLLMLLGIPALFMMTRMSSIKDWWNKTTWRDLGKARKLWSATYMIITVTNKVVPHEYKQNIGSTRTFRYRK